MGAPDTAPVTKTALADAKDGDELINDCFRECAVLLDSDPDEVSTTLLLAPAFAAGLQAWGDVGYWMEDYLEEEDEPVRVFLAAPLYAHPQPATLRDCEARGIAPETFDGGLFVCVTAV